MARRRRTPGRGDVLHERHDRQPQGRRVQPPVVAAARHGRAHRRQRRACARPTGCCRWCRCSTPTRGAWRTPAVLCGASLVMPGPDLSPPGIARLIERGARHRRRRGAHDLDGGAPARRRRHRRRSSLRTILCGGSAVPRSLTEGFHRHGVWIMQAWGMTETSPVASLSAREELAAPAVGGGRAGGAAQPGSALSRSSRPAWSTRHRSTALPWDGTSSGELQVRGPWVAREYYRPRGLHRVALTADGWLRTGDVATIDPEGYIRLVDRTKDLIKSGGEWISSVELENAIMGHPDVVEAAVVGVPHPKWDERPLACIVVRPGADARPRGAARLPRRQGRQVVAARRRHLHRGGAQDERGQVRQEGAARALPHPHPARVSSTIC